MTQKQKEINTLGKLKESGWKSRTVKEEIRENLIQHLKDNKPVFPGILGYDKTVIPQLKNALLSRHDFILLGLRGQAKTRILRNLADFLDEYMPIVAGSDINDNPYQPLSRYARELVAEKGDDTPIDWVHKSARYAEKLATPDTTVADLIGDIDPIKAATRKLTLADEHVINFGLIPKTNRGIFAINELPDLQPRIQVALLNIMQERDIQIRGFNVRIPIDVLMAFSANPEDYTNRGNIITPLKDRIDSQIITHYPRTIETGLEITKNEAWVNRNGEVEVRVPKFMAEVIEYIAFEARESEYIDQKSGVSTRLTITAMEQAVSSAERRALSNGEKSTVLRISDLFYTVPALTGKLELVYEGEQEGAINVAKLLIGQAVESVFKGYFPNPQKKTEETEAPFKPVMDWFAGGNVIDLPDDLNAKEYSMRLEQVEGLKKVTQKFLNPDKTDIPSAMDFVLEALHQQSVLSKDDLDENRSFKDMVGSMLGSLGDFDDDEFGRQN